jgi:hypothetical protein
MATPTQLSLYNGALRLLGQTRLAALTETVESRRVLDDIWDDGAVDFCLAQGDWNFATRTVRIEINTAIEPDFGFQNAFDKPSDWRRTTTVSADEYLRMPLTNPEFVDEQQYWFADISPLYVRYISNDSSYGGDYSVWSESFKDMAEAYLSWKASPRLIQNEKGRDRAEKDYLRARRLARSNDSLAEGVKFPPQGIWAGSRSGGGGRRRDRGRRNSLIG